MKNLGKILLFTICFLIIASMAYAKCKHGGCDRNCGKNITASDTCCGKNYVDKDGDGICDNAGSKGKCNKQGKGCPCSHKNTSGNESKKNQDSMDKE